MAKNKTTETQVSVTDFLVSIKDEKRRKDFSAIIDLITRQPLNSSMINKKSSLVGYKLKVDLSPVKQELPKAEVTG
jgi:hypothetical protein